jgi:GNAT superfamily N-acetyltransferase
MEIIEATSHHLNPWLQLRKQLWAEPDDIHLSEMQDILTSETAVAFLMFSAEGSPVGFIEGALYLNTPQNYGYIEGWFVHPSFQRQGLGGQLLGTLEQWFLHHAITLTFSDTIPEEYPLSPKSHSKYGYRDLMTLQIYVKNLDEGAANNKFEQGKP